MGAGALGCGPCLNGVPRMRELKSGGWESEHIPIGIA